MEYQEILDFQERSKPIEGDMVLGSQDLWCGTYSPKNLTNWWLLAILIIWLILISFLVYRKHKWEKWLWKRILKLDLIFCGIMIVLWFIASWILWMLQPTLSCLVYELN